MPGVGRALSILRNVREIISVVDADGLVVYVNEATEPVLGEAPGHSTGRPVEDWIHPDDQAQARADRDYLLGAPGRTRAAVVRVRHGDGRWVHLETHGVNLLHDPEVHGLLYVSRDVEDRVQAQAGLAQVVDRERVVAELGMRALVGHDLEGLLQDALEQAAGLLGTTWATIHELLGPDDIRVRRMLGPDPLPAGYAWATDCRSQVPLTLERRRPTTLTELLGEPGFGLSAESTARGVVDGLAVVLEGPDGPCGVLSVHTREPRTFTDAEAQFLQGVANVIAGALLRDQRERDAVERALHDDLTGLATRPLLADRLGQALRRAEREALPVAVLMVDLNGFKSVNDELGHAAGDEVLRQLGGRLEACVRAADTVARYGGDEFVVLCDELVHVDEVEQVAARIRQACAEPFPLPGGREARLSASIGTSWSTDVGTEPTALLAAADAAMYRDKRAR